MYAFRDTHIVCIHSQIFESDENIWMQRKKNNNCHDNGQGKETKRKIDNASSMRRGKYRKKRRIA